jgi:hypothetical protein
MKQVLFLIKGNRKVQVLIFPNSSSRYYRKYSNWDRFPVNLNVRIMHDLYSEK